MTSAEEVIKERDHSHGDINVQAKINIAIQREMFGPKQVSLSPIQEQSLQMIALKISRILTGDPDEPDHWLDIEGYARLARDNG